MLAPLTVLSIARPLKEELTARRFSGSVLGRFERACNLVDGEGRVIAVTLPEIGNGPFSIVVAGNPQLFGGLSVGQGALADSSGLTMGKWRLNLKAAKVWEPTLTHSFQALKINLATAGILKPYAGWSHLAEGNLLAERGGRLADRAAQLNQALLEHKNDERQEEYESVGKIMRAVGQLAGLGSGLTPAGDDYLVGVMAALWLIRRRELLPDMAKVAGAKTTALSAAFLRAAAQGQFIEPWHSLVQTLFAREADALSQAARRMAQFGASSGLDALAGFATTLLSLVPDQG